jgi:hypothetical protein
MDFLFHFQLLIGVIAQSHSAQPKLISYNQLLSSSSGRSWLQKADFRHNLNSSKLSIVAAKSYRHTQVMLQTVTLFYIHCGLSILGRTPVDICGL